LSIENLRKAARPGVWGKPHGPMISDDLRSITGFPTAFFEAIYESISIRQISQ